MDRKGTQNISISILKEMYNTMMTIREFEERVAILISSDDGIVCPVHLYTGQEAVATGVCASLGKMDHVYSTHRSHGHYIAKGGNLNTLMAEMYGNSTGCSNGAGGSMHLTSPADGLPGSPAIVAGSIPLAVGSALSFSMRDTENVAVAFFGDGAMDEGVVYESLNIAALRKLPVIFVCENNRLATHVHLADHLADTGLCKKAEAFGVPAHLVDGNDSMEVYNTAKKAVNRARSQKGPSFIECSTYRWRGHVGGGDEVDIGIRTRAELDEWKDKCPIKKLEGYLLEMGGYNTIELENIKSEINEQIEESILFAKEEGPMNINASETSQVFKA